MTDIDEIKSRLNITDIIGKHVKLKKAGRNFKGLCPFHGEKSPSFVVSPDRQIFHCFGCQKGGTVFDFVMEYHHIDFAEALEDLANIAGVKLTRKYSDSKDSGIKQNILEANHLASEYYHYILTKHELGKRGLAYLKNRDITEKSIKTFSLGYSPNSWEGLYRFLRKKGYEDELLEKAGLVIRSSREGSGAARYYDRFRGRVMFTLKDHRGNVVGFAGRILEGDEKDAKYINTSETPVYIKSNVLYGLDVTKGNIQKANEAVVMEGELDVISSFQAGIGNAVAIKGSALTEGHVRLLKRFTERVVFALDSDMAGDAAARRGIELADQSGMDMRVVTLPMGKDPDEAARESPGLLKKAIADAVPIYDYFLSSALKRYDVATAYGKKKISDELLPVIAKIDNPVIQNHYINKTAGLLKTSEEALFESMRRMGRGTVSFAPTEQANQSGLPDKLSSRTEKLEVYILALLLQGKTVDLFEELQESGYLPEFSHPTVCKIIDHLLAFLMPDEEGPETAKIFLIKDFADSLPKELLPTLDEAFLWDVEELLDSPNAFMEEWIRTLREFKRVILHRQIQELTRRGSSDDLSEKEATELQSKLKNTTMQLKDLENQT